MRRLFADEAERVNTIYERHFGGLADFTAVLENPLNVCIGNDNGFAFFVWHGPGVFEVHCCFAERGKEVRELSLTILQTMKDEHAARLIWAAIPDKSRHVKAYVRWLGFKPAGPIVTALDPDCELFVLENE